MRTPPIPLVSSTLLVLWGCASTAPELKTADYYFERGVKLMEKKNCLEAVEEFQRVVTNFPGSSLVPEAQYQLAEAHYCLKDYVQAVFEYERLMNTYPSSDWVDDAQYQIAEAYFKQLRRAELDQNETYQALTNFRRFIEDNPDSPLVEVARERIVECRTTLAKKRYLAARLYQKQKHYEASIITYNDVLRDFPDTPYYYETIARLGEIDLVQGRVAEARARWQEVLRDAEDPKLLKQIKKQLQELELQESGEK